MPNSTKSFKSYLERAKRENYDRFRGRYSLGKNRFIIAADDPSALLIAANGRGIDNVPGYAKSDAVILTLQNGHKELFADPRLRKHRDVQLAFLDAINVVCTDRDIIGYDSDHVYPKSAAIDQVGLVMMNLIDRTTNRTWGADWEKRLKHDRADGPVKIGQLAPILKALGIPMLDSKNIYDALNLGIDRIISLGYALPSERGILFNRVEDCLLDKQAQDENYAVGTGQVNLAPGKPLIL